MRRDKTYFLRRRFLNWTGFHSTACVLAVIRRTEDDVTAELTVTDCARLVKLDFDCYRGSEGAYENGLHKLDLLLDTLTRFRAAFIQANDDATYWKDGE